MAGLQGTNQLVDLLRALRRRRYQVLVPALLVSSVGTAFAVMVPKSYKISTRIEISDRNRVETDFRLRNAQDAAVRREATAAYDHIVNFARVKQTIESNLTAWPDYQLARSDSERAMFIRERILKKNLTAGPNTKDPKSGTIFVDISYSDEDKERAARFLTDLSQSWLVEMREADRAMMINDRRKFQEIMDEQAKDLLNKEKQLYGVIELLEQDPSAPNTVGQREDRGDWAFKSLEKAKSDLSEVDFQLTTAEFEAAQVREHFEQEPETISEAIPLEAQDPTVKLELFRRQHDELAERLSNLRPENPTYKRLKPKLDQLELEIAELMNREPEESERWVEKENPLKAEYALELRQKEDEVGRLKEQRRALLARVESLEVETKGRIQNHRLLEDLRNQVSEARAALNETRRQWQDRDKSLQLHDASPLPWRIAQPPVPTTATTQPNPYLLSGVSIFAGLALGLALALASEFARSCYRSVGDLAAVMSVPVLGAIDTIRTRKERRRAQFSRAVAGLSTAIIVGTIGWVTYLWHSAPERLPLEVQGAIERMRSALK